MKVWLGSWRVKRSRRVMEDSLRSWRIHDSQVKIMIVIECPFHGWHKVVRNYEGLECPGGLVRKICMG